MAMLKNQMVILDDLGHAPIWSSDCDLALRYGCHFPGSIAGSNTDLILSLWRVYAPCMVYLPTFGWFLGQMLVNIPYMEHLGRVYRSSPRTCEHPQLPNSIISPVHFLRGGSSWSHSAHDHPKAGGPLGPGGQNSEQWFWAAQWILGSCAGELLESGLSLRSGRVVTYEVGWTTDPAIWRCGNDPQNGQQPWGGLLVL